MTWRLLLLVGCSLLRCVLLLVQSIMCFLTRVTQRCLATPPAPSASSPEPRSIRYFWVRSRFVRKLALSFTFHFAMFDSSHWPWVLVGNVGKSERLTVAARFSSISRPDVDQASLTRTSVRKILVFFLRNFSFSPCPSMSIGIDRDALAVSGVIGTPLSLSSINFQVLSHRHRQACSHDSARSSGVRAS